MHITCGIFQVSAAAKRFSKGATHQQTRGPSRTFFAIEHCEKCGAEMLAANWPVTITAPVKWTGGLPEYEGDIENIPESAPEGLCGKCFEETEG